MHTFLGHKGGDASSPCVTQFGVCSETVFSSLDTSGLLIVWDMEKKQEIQMNEGIQCHTMTRALLDEGGEGLDVLACVLKQEAFT